MDMKNATFKLGLKFEAPQIFGIDPDWMFFTVCSYILRTSLAVKPNLNGIILQTKYFEVRIYDKNSCLIDSFQSLATGQFGRTSPYSPSSSTLMDLINAFKSCLSSKWPPSQSKYISKEEILKGTATLGCNYHTSNASWNVSKLLSLHS